jgi:glutathione peroxidase
MAAHSIHDFKVVDIDGKEFDFGQMKGKYGLVVNVASKCGFTKQYTGLEQLWQDQKDKLTIVGFPCNQFGSQEPGGEEEIKSFCSLKYNVTFPIMKKVEVNGDGAAPVYKWMKHAKPGLFGTEGIKWNFTKFLIDKNGEIIKRYSPTESPEDIAKDFQKILAKGA